MRGAIGARGIATVALEPIAGVGRTPGAGPPAEGGVVAGRARPSDVEEPVGAIGLGPGTPLGLAAPGRVAEGVRPVPAAEVVDGGDARGGSGGGIDGARPVEELRPGGGGGATLAGRGPGIGGGVGFAGTAPSSSISCVDSRPAFAASGLWISTLVDSSSRGGVGPAIGGTLLGRRMDLKRPVRAGQRLLGAPPRI